MSSVGERLRNFWLSRGMRAHSGATEEELRKFESRHEVRLPPVMRGYFAAVDGMDDSWGWDEDGFCFWPLHRLVRASARYLDWFVKDQASLFVFADHLIACPSYAIHLCPRDRPDSLILAIFADNRHNETGIMADSFSEFVERYLAYDIPRIDLSAGLPSRGDVATPKASIHPLADSAHPLWDGDLDR
jgi:hypothetical protein